jgi:thiosulfate dehydrogenase
MVVVIFSRADKKRDVNVIKKYRLMFLVVAGIVVIIGILTISSRSDEGKKTGPGKVEANKPYTWTAPDTGLLGKGPGEDLIRYGRDLVAYTNRYLGPKGKIAAITNGMNCQNCHLDAGTRTGGNNYSGVYSTYPKFRARSGTLENISKRVNDCIERSLNGTKTLDTNSREMQAFYAYIKWLGEDVPKDIRPAGAGIRDIAFPDRAADPVKGKAIYEQDCQRCHGIGGEGVPQPATGGYIYPPLWGGNSYTTAAGLFRLSRLAGFIRDNMPFDAPQSASLLTDEEAWDVAAYINSQPRPQRFFTQDWPDISGKPFDYPFGPYADSFSERQHKYGPFGPIVEKNR